MRYALVAAVAALLLVPAAALGDPTDQISERVSSWGRPVESWTLNEDGSGEISASRQTGPGFADYVTETRKLAPATGHYAQVAKVLQLLQSYDTKPLACRKRFTDMPYGEVDWRRGGVTHRFDFDDGCERTDEWMKAYDQMDAARSLIENWAAGPVTTSSPATSSSPPPP